MEVMERLSDKIRNARRDAGMNQLELAKASGVGAATVARLEAGTQDDPKISTLRRLAGALGVDVRDLLPED
jgi:transcriptional regulator with XRE-family HTH domain